MGMYSSFLLRIWDQVSDSDRTWRATLESTATHKVYRFSSMKDLSTFLGSFTKADLPSEGTYPVEQSRGESG